MKHLCVYAMLFLSFVAGCRAFAQSTSAAISGIVTDPAGRAIADASVMLINDATGVEYPTRTNGVGIYSIPVLPPGHYHMQVSKVGFKTIIKPDIILNVQSALGINYSLPVGAASESVTVRAGSSLLNTTDASVSTVIDHQFVKNMPLNGRSFQDLISMTPGVVTQSPQSYTNNGYNGDFSVNGQRTESNYYTVDGVSANINAGYPTGGAQTATGGTIPASTALGTTQSLLSVDALQEFRVQSATYSAEYGGSPGGQFAFVTRSGTNAVHGSLFEYLRNNYFDANDWFNDHYRDPISPLRQNDFGGTVGGPITIPHLYRGTDRSFFFVSYEGLRLVQPQAASIQYVPDNAIRSNAPVSLQSILNAFPLPTPGGVDSGIFAQFIQGYSLPGNINSTSIRLDQHVSSRWSLFFRYGYTPSFVESRILSEIDKDAVTARTFTFGLTGQLSPSLTNEFRLGYARSASTTTTDFDNFGGAAPINLANAMGIGSAPTAYAAFYMFIPGIGSSYLIQDDATNRSRQWNLVDTVSKVAGRHQLKFGFDYRSILSPLNPPTPYAFAEYASGASILNNAATFLELQNSLPAYPIFHEFGVFAQDEWAIVPRVSLSLGLRWEMDPPPGTANGLPAYTVSGSPSNPASLTLDPRGTALWATGHYNFAPRLGVAYQASTRPGWETVLRAGGGVFFDTNNSVAAGGFSALGFSSYQTYSSAPLPVTAEQINFPVTVAAPYTGASVYAFPQHLQLPYTLQWSAAVEQALGRSQALTITYVGSNGRRLQQQQTFYVTASNPNFGYVYAYPSGVTSSYNALQAQFQRTVRHGLEALASYTWSHSLDFGSTDASLPLTRGNSDFDVRNNFQAGLTWDLSEVAAYGWKAVTLDHWGLDLRAMARTAFPVTLSGNTLTNPVSGYYTSNANLVPGKPIYLYGNQYPGGRAVNPEAFALPNGNDPGDAPRNFVRGFGENQFNFAVRRQFPIVDRASVQFRAEAFNILNHPNFGYVDPSLEDKTFGLATKSLNQSLGTVASQYQQGGPRSMQFSLRLLF